MAEGGRASPAASSCRRELSPHVGPIHAVAAPADWQAVVTMTMTETAAAAAVQQGEAVMSHSMRCLQDELVSEAYLSSVCRR